MESWSDFFVAFAGVAAALTGLIFVGISISLNRILAIPKLPGRASAALILLTTVVVVCSLCLVPKQPHQALGAELLFIGIIVWALTFRLDIGGLRATGVDYKTQYQLNLVLTQLATLPYIAGGLAVLRLGFNGLYYLVPGLIVSVVKAVVDAWVLLVEIHR